MLCSDAHIDNQTPPEWGPSATYSRIREVPEVNLWFEYSPSK